MILISFHKQMLFLFRQATGKTTTNRLREVDDDVPGSYLGSY